jgi:hypothetical protein
MASIQSQEKGWMLRRSNRAINWLHSDSSCVKPTNIYTWIFWIEIMWYQQLFAQIGPAYDPLFYDVMVYIFGTMLFAVFLLGVIAFWLRRKGLGGGAAKEKWAQELERYFEREQIGLIPDERHHW